MTTSFWNEVFEQAFVVVLLVVGVTVLGYAIWRIVNRYLTSQAETHKALMELTREVVTALQNNTNALENNTKAFDSLKDTITDEFKALSTDLEKVDDKLNKVITTLKIKEHV